MTIAFADIARLPAPGDNAAVAVQRIEAGQSIVHDDRTYTISHTVMEGHRFASEPIGEGAALLSWGLPFGRALCDIEAGDYICNVRMLEVLSERHANFNLPKSTNFIDQPLQYQFDQGYVTATAQVSPAGSPRYFSGYPRGAGRGVGTRNTIVILGTSSLAGSFVRALAQRFDGVVDRYPNIDTVAPVAHTEGGEDKPNNRELVLRTLSGFVVHPNVGGVLAVDYGDEAVNNVVLQQYMNSRGYPLDAVLHAFMSLRGGALSAQLQRGEQVVHGWLDQLNKAERVQVPLGAMKLALQCGGSDAFSGISGNPLAGWVARETIRQGGAANLAETSELIGSERYLLSKVRDVSVARTFLSKMEAFKQLAGCHGHDAEGNTSGGNYLRGLYNITLKSLGAARKKLPDVALDEVIGYSERMEKPGFYFMDSPGNDLESIAGQVASGANLILFTTGNGSITNFPFVPTIKIVTTTGRFDLVAGDMDVNAGRYQDGMPLADLGAETFDLAIEVASGRKSAGEKAGHSQVQLWRNWRQSAPGDHRKHQNAPAPDGQPLAIRRALPSDLTFEAYRCDGGYAADQVGAVAPTSLCSGQIARLIVSKLNQRKLHSEAVSRYVTFTHTEGCGTSTGENETLFTRTLIGHISHPIVRCGLFLEHGCEKTHNDAIRNRLNTSGMDAARFGWASVQLDGGINRVTDRVIDWFDRHLSTQEPLTPNVVGLEHLQLGLMTAEPASDAVAIAFAHLASIIVGSSGTVVVPRNASLFDRGLFVSQLGLPAEVVPTLSYGQRPTNSGFHVMEAPTRHVAETLTGLGATGVEVMLAAAGHRPLQTHPMIPLLQVGSEATIPDLDMLIEDNADGKSKAAELLELICLVASRQYVPRLFAQGYSDFQVTRGLLGVSL